MRDLGPLLPIASYKYFESLLLAANAALKVSFQSFEVSSISLPESLVCSPLPPIFLLQSGLSPEAAFKLASWEEQALCPFLNINEFRLIMLTKANKEFSLELSWTSQNIAFHVSYDAPTMLIELGGP